MTTNSNLTNSNLTNSNSTNMLATVADRPAYLAEVKADNSDLATYAKPPRLKVIQGASGPPYKPPFKEGDAIIVPQMIKIGDEETPFTFVPIHFFPSWVCLNPIEMKGQLPAVREYTLDPMSELAKKTISVFRNNTIVPCPEKPQYRLRYQETLNFIIVLPEHPEMKNFPLRLFFTGGEYPYGQMLIGAIQMRRAPRYSCRFSALVTNHPNSKGAPQKGLTIFNDPTPWVANEEEFNRYRALYEEFDALIKQRNIDLSVDDATESSVTTEF